MRVKAYNSLQDPRPIDVTANMVVIEKEDGTPIGIACDDGAGFIHISHAGEGDVFTTMLRNLGVDKLVVVERLDDLLSFGSEKNPPSQILPPL